MFCLKHVNINKSINNVDKVLTLALQLLCPHGAEKIAKVGGLTNCELLAFYKTPECTAVKP